MNHPRPTSETVLGLFYAVPSAIRSSNHSALVTMPRLRPFGMNALSRPLFAALRTAEYGIPVALAVSGIV